MDLKLNEKASGLKKYFDFAAKAVKNNWRVLLIILIVAVVFVNSWENDKKLENSDNIANNSQKTETRQTSAPENRDIASGPNVAQPNIVQAEEMPKFSEQSVITEIAAKSEGVTHLARRAIKKYTEKSGENLSPEQKIYMEDFLKKKVGSQKLKIGQKIEFKTELISLGIEKAKTLNQKQIKNLSKFVPLVKNL